MMDRIGNKMIFCSHRVPVGIHNGFLLRGERTNFIDSGAPMGIKRAYPLHGMDCPVEVIQKEIADFDRLHPSR